MTSNELSEGMLSRTLKRQVGLIARSLRGPNYELDPALTIRALSSTSIRRILALTRAFLRGLLLSKEGLHIVFLERGVELRNRNKISVGSGVTIGRGTIINGLSIHGISIGDGVSIGQYCIIEATGTLKDLGEGLSIGNGSSLGCFSFIGAAGGIEIGDDVLIGNRVSFHSENHKFVDINRPIREQGVTRRGISISDDCWIGANATFLDGSSIGRGSVVAAGSVVRGVFPAFSVIAGVPAKIVRSRIDANSNLS